MLARKTNYRNYEQVTEEGIENPVTMQTTTDLPCSDDIDHDEVPAPRYTPSDIAQVQHILRHFVPTELADVILDMAEYWPYVGISRNSFASAYSALEAPDGNAQWAYLVTPPVPPFTRNGVPLPTTVRKVRFLVKAYASSWGASDASVDPKEKTWFEALPLKKDDEVASSYEDGMHPNDWFAHLAHHPRYLMDSLRETPYAGTPVDNPFDDKTHWHVIDNISSASKDSPWREAVWGGFDAPGSSDFVNSLGVDDRILLLAKSPTPGWLQTVFNVKIEIYYSLASSLA